MALLAVACSSESDGESGASGAAAPSVSTASTQESASASPTADGSSTAGPTTSGKKVTITWWSHNNPTFVAGNKKFIADFEAKNPNVKIEFTSYPYDVFVTKLRAVYRTKDAPDVVQMFGTWVTDYARQGLLAPLPDDLAAKTEGFWPAAVGAYKLDGKTYGLPHEFNIEAGGMLVDPGKLEAAGVAVPKTWDELVEAGKKLTKVDGSGNATQVGFNFINNDTITFMFLANILSQGATYWAADGKHVDFSTPAALKAWQAETDLITRDKVDDEKWHPTLGATDVFFKGQSAMSMVGPYSICLGREQFPNQKFEYVPVPKFAESDAFAAESGWGEVVSAKSSDEKKKVAFEFLASMSEPDAAREWNVRTCTVPPLKALQDDPELKKAIPGIETSLSILDKGQWIGDVKDRDLFFQYIHDALTEVALGKDSADSAIKKAQDKINTMIDKKK